jgi:hypothetical protein
MRPERSPERRELDWQGLIETALTAPGHMGDTQNPMRLRVAAAGHRSSAQRSGSVVARIHSDQGTPRSRSPVKRRLCWLWVDDGQHKLNRDSEVKPRRSQWYWA